MVINISVQYNGGFLPDIILLTQGYCYWGTRLNTMCDDVLHCLCFVFSVFSGVPAWRLM